MVPPSVCPTRLTRHLKQVGRNEKLIRKKDLLISFIDFMKRHKILEYIQAFFVQNPVEATQVKSRGNEFWHFGNEFLAFGNEFLLIGKEFGCFRKESGPF